MIPEIYLFDDGGVCESALVAMWGRVRATRRRVAIGLRAERLETGDLAKWEARNAAVCVVGSPEDVLDRETDGLHLLHAPASAVRAARRVIGPERLLLAPGPPRGREVWEDVESVDAWLVAADEADAAFPGLVWVQDRKEAERARPKARGLAVFASRFRVDDVQWMTTFCESAYDG